MNFTSMKIFGDLKLIGLNDSISKTTLVRVVWDGEFQETIRVATNCPLEAVNLVAEQLMVEKI